MVSHGSAEAAITLAGLVNHAGQVQAGWVSASGRIGCKKFLSAYMHKQSGFKGLIELDTSGTHIKRCSRVSQVVPDCGGRSCLEHGLQL